MDDNVGGDDKVEEIDWDKYLREDDKRITKTLKEMQDIEELIMHVVMERYYLESSTIDTSRVTSDSTILIDVQGTDALVGAALQPDVSISNINV